jgi:TrmH family RNA methyltransferase
VSGIEIYATAEWLGKFPQAIEISQEIAKKVSDTITTQGIFALVPIPQSESDLTHADSVAIFLELQDPGNAGTILRSAHAFGCGAVLFSKSSVDPYCAKVVRASAGSVSAVPLHYGVEAAEIIESLRSSHQILAFDMAGEELDGVATTKPVVMIFGNEARGLPSAILKDPSIKKVRIPMAHGIESLNVASAATIAMYEISRSE